MSMRTPIAGALALLAIGLTACTRGNAQEIGGTAPPPGDVSTSKSFSTLQITWSSTRRSPGSLTHSTALCWPARASSRA